MPRKSSREIIVHTIGLTEGNIRTTPDKRVSIYDAIVAATGAKSPRVVWIRLKVQYPEVVTFCNDYKFPGRRQRPTPVTNKEGFLKILNLLPGDAARAFREASAKVVLRYLEGDPTLAEEIIDRQDDPDVLNRLALRAKSVVVRNKLTDTYKIHGAIANGTINTYAQCTGLLNQGITGSKSKEIQAHTGIKKTRDGLPSQYLSLMMAAEEFTTASIVHNHAHGHDQLFATTAIVADDFAELRKKHGIPDWPGSKP